ncbi:Uncharacterised protein [Slackia heliotrinireducens]|uniref:Uncharacterized protein n=1 Tax=Slackia heliotrinireducens (strain ATCC 29202 / DSM 20476 / NCTC 11029 / RHS 1) TaxID=471855 RepID=C7N0Z3_SLAHD|nr:hypothetical protein [Slackia heliotrinireducens]ACV23215.1 hypothetical protein Shel_22050 [Slackia heliotrinireducens DSM 20476]VEH02321.1 Uncharacterised protein [Slackia heliotrinireducens]
MSFYRFDGFLISGTRQTYSITVNEMFFPRDGERSIIAIRFDELYEKAKERTSDAKQAKNAALALLEAENEVKRWYKITKL